jgi:hypothetical protein
MAHGFEQVHGAHHVGGEGIDRVEQGLADLRLAGEVEHHIGLDRRQRLQVLGSRTSPVVVCTQLCRRARWNRLGLVGAGRA